MEANNTGTDEQIFNVPRHSGLTTNAGIDLEGEATVGVETTAEESFWLRCENRLFCYANARLRKRVHKDEFLRFIEF